MGGGSISSREAFSGNNERGGVWSEVEEELSQDVEGKETVFAEVRVGEPDDNKEDGKHDEAHKLDWLATNGVNRSDCNPITWN